MNPSLAHANEVHQRVTRAKTKNRHHAKKRKAREQFAYVLRRQARERTKFTKGIDLEGFHS